MIDIENLEVYGWEAAIRGMRNPMNSWNMSDSVINEYGEGELGDKDYKLMMNLKTAGTDHRKFMRMINVTCDITAPLYWWKEFDTYKVGTVANSCSTMHKISERPLELNDFSTDRMFDDTIDVLDSVIKDINLYMELFKQTKHKEYWWQIIQLLPSSFNQKRTVQMNYEVIKNIIDSRKNHKLDEWIVFCNFMIEQLPYSALIQ